MTIFGVGTESRVARCFFIGGAIGALVIGLATLASTPGMAQPLLGVEVIPPAPKTAAPGDFITLVYLVKNRGTTADSDGSLRAY